jgi:hypothetical protein
MDGALIKEGLAGNLVISITEVEIHSSPFITLSVYFE